MLTSKQIVNKPVESDLGFNEPLPDDIKLFQQLEIEQMLLPENARCLAVRAFLKMCNLKYEVVQRRNAEEMSPSGRVPFVKCDDFLISELEPLLRFLENKGITLTGDLDNLTKSDMRAYKSLVTNGLANAELYITWVDEETFNQVCKARVCSVHPWPLGWYLTVQKRSRVHRRLSALGWMEKSIEEVLEEVNSCCSALSERLEDNMYFFGDKPTELDAMVFAHIFTILTTTLPSNLLADTIRRYRNLVDHCMRIEREHFKPNSGSNKLL